MRDFAMVINGYISKDCVIFTNGYILSDCFMVTNDYISRDCVIINGYISRKSSIKYVICTILKWL